MNGSGRPHILLGARNGWHAASLDAVALAGGGAMLELAPRPGATISLDDPAGTIGGLHDPAGLAVDGLGRLYILDRSDARVRRYDPCSCAFATLPCVGGMGGEPRRFRDPRGMAVSGRGDLYVADTGNRRVQVFAVKGLVLRDIWGPFRFERAGDGAWRCRPAAPGSGGLWEPCDVAVACGGRVYVADLAHGLVHRFDERGCWRGAFDGAGAEPPLRRPIRLAAGRDGRIYVVEEGGGSVLVMDADGKFVTRVTAPDDLTGRFRPSAVAVDRQGNLHVGDRFTGRLCCYEPGKEAAYRYVGPSGACDSGIADLVFDRSGNAVLAGASGGLVLAPQSALFATEGHFTAGPLDSRLYRCPWHRVILRGTIPARSRVVVHTLTAEAPKPPEEVASLPEGRWAEAGEDDVVGEGEWDCLVQSPPGRYLWLRLTLDGSGSVTPSVRQVQVDYPRASSLQYLPASYSEDEESREFLDRFLSVFDTIRDGLGDAIGGIAALFDPAAVPASCDVAGCTDFLSWLASWLGLSLDRHWPEEHRRRLVARAHDLYRLRGTLAGLKLHLALYTGRTPEVLEHFKLRRWLSLGHGRLGDNSALWGDAVVARLQLDAFSAVGSFQLVGTGEPLTDPFASEAHRFTVFLPKPGDYDAVERQTVERIIEMAKPAHTLGVLRTVHPRLRAGVESFVGMSTVVGEYPGPATEGRSGLGRDALLGPAAGDSGPPGVRVGTSSRLGTTCRLD